MRAASFALLVSLLTAAAIAPAGAAGICAALDKSEGVEVRVSGRIVEIDREFDMVILDDGCQIEVYGDFVPRNCRVGRTASAEGEILEDDENGEAFLGAYETVQCQ